MVKPGTIRPPIGPRETGLHTVAWAQHWVEIKMKGEKLVYEHADLIMGWS